MSLDLLADFFVERPEPLIGAKTIQVLLLRNLHDYTVLRTEDTRELNTVVTPRSTSDDTLVSRVAWLATKQRASESRTLEGLLRTAASEAGYSAPECYLKDQLCMECPRCLLFGATNTRGGGERANIKHRIEYSTAFSLAETEDISTATTFNAVDGKTLSTGQALNTRFATAPAVMFPSVVTFRSVSRDEFVWAVKMLLATHSYGAESRIGGDCRNLVVCFVGGWEEIITSLEWCMELCDAEIETIAASSVAGKYLQFAAQPNKVRVLDTFETESVLAAVSEVALDEQLVKRSYQASQDFRRSQLQPIASGGRSRARR